MVNRFCGYFTCALALAFGNLGYATRPCLGLGESPQAQRPMRRAEVSGTKFAFPGVNGYSEPFGTVVVQQIRHISNGYKKKLILNKSYEGNNPVPIQFITSSATAENPWRNDLRTYASVIAESDLGVARSQLINQANQDRHDNNEIRFRYLAHPETRRGDYIVRLQEASSSGARLDLERELTSGAYPGYTVPARMLEGVAIYEIGSLGNIGNAPRGTRERLFFEIATYLDANHLQHGQEAFIHLHTAGVARARMYQSFGMRTILQYTGMNAMEHFVMEMKASEIVNRFGSALSLWRSMRDDVDRSPLSIAATDLIGLSQMRFPPQSGPVQRTYGAAMNLQRSMANERHHIISNWSILNASGFSLTDDQQDELMQADAHSPFAARRFRFLLW